MTDIRTEAKSKKMKPAMEQKGEQEESMYPGKKKKEERKETYFLRRQQKLGDSEWWDQGFSSMSKPASKSHMLNFQEFCGLVW